VSDDPHQEHSYEEESYDITTAACRAPELLSLQAIVAKVTPESSTRKQSLRTFKPMEDTRAVQIDPEDANKTVWIGCRLSNK
jgi:hypothetical protein